MTPIQIIAIAFGAVMGYLTYIGFRRRQFVLRGLVLWEVIWAGLVVVSLFPQPFQAFVHPLHVARLFDLVVVAGLLVLGAITYRNYATVQQLRDKLEQDVRDEALASVVPETNASLQRSDDQS